MITILIQSVKLTNSPNACIGLWFEQISSFINLEFIHSQQFTTVQIAGVEPCSKSTE